MNRVDRILQDWRIRRALPWVPAGGHVLDVGCSDGALFHKLGARLGSGVDMDPTIEQPTEHGRFRLVPGTFPETRLDGAPFDAVTFLAVLEHVSDDAIDGWAVACRKLLVPGGLVVATVPSPVVDPILDIAIKLHVLHGMEVDQHHGFEPSSLVDAFRRAGFDPVATKRFQLGLNNLYVLRNPVDSTQEQAERSKLAPKP
jgi:2-polyprenyl-3-methyl-5-hydroxy-6-metoxy-1,4-benzoquinol methylase